MSSEPDISVARFLWIETFTARLKELGAPATEDQLLELGQRLFERYGNADARVVAEATWARWPTQDGPLPTH